MVARGSGMLMSWGWRLEVGGWRLEVGGWRLEVVAEYKRGMTD